MNNEHLYCPQCDKHWEWARIEWQSIERGYSPVCVIWDINAICGHIDDQTVEEWEKTILSNADIDD